MIFPCPGHIRSTFAELTISDDLHEFPEESEPEKLAVQRKGATRERRTACLGAKFEVLKSIKNVSSDWFTQRNLTENHWNTFLYFNYFPKVCNLARVSIRCELGDKFYSFVSWFIYRVTLGVGCAFSTAMQLVFVRPWGPSFTCRYLWHVGAAIDVFRFSLSFRLLDVLPS